MQRALNFLHSTRAGGRATVLQVTYIDLHTSDAFVGRFESSELDLLLETDRETIVLFESF